MKPAVSRVLMGIVALLVACTLAYEHECPVWGSKGTFGNGCRKQRTEPPEPNSY